MCTPVSADHRKQRGRTAPNFSSFIKHKNKWISVKDTLPTYSGDYLVYIKDSNVAVNKVCGYNATKKYWLYNGVTINNVTHWMELPNRPE